MLLHVTHATRYHYTPVVESANHIAYLKPADQAGQKLVSHALHISPKPAQQRELRDVYGNHRQFFSLQSSHDCLEVVAHSVVFTSTNGSNHLDRHDLFDHSQIQSAALPWEKVRDHFKYQAGSAYNNAWDFVFASPYVPREPAFTQFARPSFTPGRPLDEAAHDLMARIHRSMTFESHSTEVNTPALEALAQRKGVCQDFAHIMVACCRAMGLPARYVSGYMLTQPPAGQARLIGCDASHAWASVYCPLSGEHGAKRWLDFDPTNNRAPDEDYVTLATGRDFLDVSPLRGVIRGGAQHVLEVAVTVTPLDSSDLSSSSSRQALPAF